MALAVTGYDELKLHIDHSGDGYRVLATSTQGEARSEFELPFATMEVENFVLRMSRGRRGTRRVETSEIDRAREFGRDLFNALVRDDVRELYHRSMAQTEGEENRGLRLSLALTGVPELMEVPWEFMFDDPNFLSVSVWTPMVRYLDLPTPKRPLRVKPPLRILGMVSSPTDYDVLDVGHERRNVEEALANLVDRGLVELEWLEDATLRGLRRLLMQGDDFHVFHYVGHAHFDEQAGSGAILLEDSDGRSRSVPAWKLGQALHDNRKSLRLVVLNACEGALTARDDPFSGVAPSIVQQGIPAVIAMQFEITDEAAIVFAEGFYEAVAAGYPVDAALAEARMAILADDNDVEWATPVLFMRVPDGRIFDVPDDDDGGGRDGDNVKDEPAGLELALHPEPPDCEPGERIVWKLRAKNTGASELTEVTVHDGPGRRVAGPIALGGHETRELGWDEFVDHDLEQTVTVGGRAQDGSVVSAQASGRVHVIEPPPPEPARPEPPPEPPEPPEPEPPEPEPEPEPEPVPPPPEPPREDRKPDGGGDQPGWRRYAPLGIGVLAVALVALVAFLLLKPGGSATETVPLGSQPDGVVFGADSVWVGHREGSTVSRVDPDSLSEAQEIRVGRGQPDSLAWSEDSDEVWVTLQDTDSAVPIEPGREEPSRSVDLPGKPEGVATGFGAVWVANNESGSVTRITDSDDAEQQVGEGPVHLAASLENMWVTVSGQGRVKELNRDTGRPTGRSVRVPGEPRGIAFDGKFLWVAASSASKLAVIDPGPPRVVASISVDPNPREVRFGEEAIWVTSAGAGTVTKIDPDSRTIADRVELGGPTFGLAVGGGYVWATSPDSGELTRIDPDSL